jgi:AraC family cel operon transcriptional repressor
MRKLYWQKLCPGGEPVHVAHVAAPQPVIWGEHTHDFYEAFFVQSGTATHVCNGRSRRLRPGSLVFIRPPDAHGFRPLAGSEVFRFINVAFPAPAWRELRARYELADHPFFQEPETTPDPPTPDLQAAQTRRVDALFQQMLTGDASVLARDSFLLNLALELGSSRSRELPEDLPPWLRHALHAFDPREHLAGGVNALARLADRGPEHLSRLMRRHLGLTPSQWLNRQRLDYAARLLETTSLAVGEVALEAGFENLSHFHRLFKGQHGVTPRQYRVQRQRAIL